MRLTGEGQVKSGVKGRWFKDGGLRALRARLRVKGGMCNGARNMCKMITGFGNIT